MAVQIPLWLSIDPIEPARLAAARAARQQQAAIAERAAQQRQQEMELRAQVEAAHIAQQDRAAYQRQIMSERLAQQEAQRRAEDAQIRRELHARQAAQFQQTIQLRQDAAQRAAEEASVQTEAWQGVQKNLDAGMPMDKAMLPYMGKLFYRKPAQAMSAFKERAPLEAPTFGTTPSGREYVQGRGVHLPPSLNPKPARTDLSPSEKIRALSTQFAILQNRIGNESDPAKQGAMQKQQEAIFQQLQQLTAPRSPGKLDESTPPEEEPMPMEDQAPPEAVGDEGDATDEEAMAATADDQEE